MGKWGVGGGRYAETARDASPEATRYHITEITKTHPNMGSQVTFDPGLEGNRRGSYRSVDKHYRLPTPVPTPPNGTNSNERYTGATQKFNFPAEDKWSRRLGTVATSLVIILFITLLALLIVWPAFMNARVQSNASTAHGVTGTSDRAGCINPSEQLSVLIDGVNVAGNKSEPGRSGSRAVRTFFGIPYATSGGSAGRFLPATHAKMKVSKDSNSCLNFIHVSEIRGLGVLLKEIVVLALLDVQP
ncbi:uncharacterized protein LOC144146345 [Haemaphysalis longicornis]